MTDNITLARSVVEQALKALEKSDRISGYRNNWAAVNSLIAALEQPEIDHAHELRRHSRKLGEPVGETAGVMQRAADEIERLRAMLAAAPQPKLYPLPDDLYGGSKDWRAGSYAERVEWLHLMYEGAKEEIERLGQTQGEQAQPKRDPLSDEQILKLGWAVTPYANQMEMLSIARAIEAAHGIGGDA